MKDLPVASLASSTNTDVASSVANRTAVLTLYLAIALLAFNGVFARLLPADALTITQLRSVVAAIGFVVFLSFQRRSVRLGSWKEYLGVYLLGVIVGGHWATFFHAMQVSTIAIGILSFYSYPVVTVLMEPFFTRKRLRFIDFVAALCVFFGILILVVDDRYAISLWFSSNYVEGAFWGVFSAVLMSTRNLFQKFYFSDVSSTSLMFHQVIAICIFAVPFLDVSAVADFDASSWCLIIALGIFATAGGHTLIVVSLKTLPARSVAMISCIQPVFAIFLGWLFLDELPAQHVFLGGSLILSVALYESWRQSRKAIPVGSG